MRKWKELERHPLSAEYDDLTGWAWEDFVANLKENGLADRKITLHDGKVLDGWQLLRACKEVDIEPDFSRLAKDADPEAFVATANDHRRHESDGLRKERREKRIARVAAARADGKSTRAIAEEAGVSQSTVLNDLAVSTEQGCSVETPEGKVTGKDGKKRKASTKKKKATAETEQPAEPETLKDSVDCDVPPGLATVFEKAKEFKAIVNQFNDIKRKLVELHKHAAGSDIRLQQTEIDIRNAKESVRFSMPYAVCPVCHGNAKKRLPNCPCKNRGWLVETSYKNLPAEFRS